MAAWYMTNRASRPEAWFEKAEHDLLVIRKVMVGDDVPWDMVAFHAQQAAEKYFKGYLVSCGVDPPRTHELASLLSLCCDHNPALVAFKDDCEVLSHLGWASRYPDSPTEPDESDARRAVDIAQRVRDAIRQRVPPGEAPE